MDAMSLSMGVAPDGALLIWVRFRNGADTVTQSMNLYRSLDDGDSWSLWQTINSWSVATPQVLTSMVNRNGVLYCWWHTMTTYMWGVVTSSDNGATWEQTLLGTEAGASGHPIEAQLYVTEDDRILGLARTQVFGEPIIQIQFDGTTWTKADTNITDSYESNGAMVGSDDDLSVYYFERSDGSSQGGALHTRRTSVSDVWGNPTGWPQATTIGLGSHERRDTGQVNATQMDSGDHAVVYYSGSNGTADIYAVRGIRGTVERSIRLAAAVQPVGHVSVLAVMDSVNEVTVPAASSAPGLYIGSAFFPLTEYMTRGRLYWRIIGRGYCASSAGRLTVGCRFRGRTDWEMATETAFILGTSEGGLDTGWAPFPDTFGRASTSRLRNEIQFRAWSNANGISKLHGSSRLLLGFVPVA
jgi:hypothetical protein